MSSAGGAGSAAVAATGVSVTAWPGTSVTITVTPRPLGHAISQGQPVARATVTIGGEVRHITLVAGPGRAGTAGALAAHPAMSRPGVAAVPDAGPEGTAPPGHARPVCPRAILSLAPARR